MAATTDSSWIEITEPLLRALIASTAMDSDPDRSRHRVFVLNTTTTARSIDDLLRHLEIKEDGPPPASQASIDALVPAEVKPGEDCAICLEEYDPEEEARELPCKHKFHCNCVEKWLRMNGSCPVCRYRMPAEETSRHGTVEEDEGRGRVTFMFVSAAVIRSRAAADQEGGGGGDESTEDEDSIS